MVITAGQLDACFKYEVSFAHDAQMEEKSTSGSHSTLKSSMTAVVPAEAQPPQHRGMQRKRGDAVAIQAFIGRLSNGDADAREAAATAFDHSTNKEGDTVGI